MKNPASVRIEPNRCQFYNLPKSPGQEPPASNNGQIYPRAQINCTIGDDHTPTGWPVENCHLLHGQLRQPRCVDESNSDRQPYPPTAFAKPPPRPFSAPSASEIPPGCPGLWNKTHPVHPPWHNSRLHTRAPATHTRCTTHPRACNQGEVLAGVVAGVPLDESPAGAGPLLTWGSGLTNPPLRTHPHSNNPAMHPAERLVTIFLSFIPALYEICT